MVTLNEITTGMRNAASKINENFDNLGTEINALEDSNTVSFPCGYGVTMKCARYGKVVIATIDGSTPTSTIPKTGWTVLNESIPADWVPKTTVWLTAVTGPGTIISYKLSEYGSITIVSEGASSGFITGSTVWILP